MKTFEIREKSQDILMKWLTPQLHITLDYRIWYQIIARHIFVPNNLICITLNINENLEKGKKITPK